MAAAGNPSVVRPNPRAHTRRKPQTFTSEQKAEAVARVLAGDAVSRVAKDVGTQPSTIRLWRAQAGGDPKTKNTDYAQVVLKHLELAFVALDRILGQTADPVWLGKQPAAELATLYGVIFDKQARVLAAIRSDEPEPERLPVPAGDPDGGVVADTLGGTTAS